MDILLLVITVVSLIIALLLGIAAWSMWREERARSAARVAALAAAAEDAGEPIAPPADRLPSPVPAPAQKAAPWGPPQTQPRRRETLASAAAAAPHETAAMHEAFLGSALSTPPSSSRQGVLAVAASALLVVLLTGAYITMSGDARPVAGVAAVAPLELVSLSHERQDGVLAITGLVRNPVGGEGVEQLSAVAMLFDQQGEFVTSARARVDFTQLPPGDESPFVIRLDAPAHVARYRVSFRTDTGLIPHVDRRGQDPAHGDNAQRGEPTVARDMP